MTRRGCFGDESADLEQHLVSLTESWLQSFAPLLQGGESTASMVLSILQHLDAQVSDVPVSSPSEQHSVEEVSPLL